MRKFEYRSFQDTSLEKAREQMLRFVNDVSAHVVHIETISATLVYEIGIYFYFEES